MSSKRLQGVVIALPTPLRQNEDIDVDSLKKLLDYCVDGGVNAIMIGGTMGEGAALVDEQKEVLFETTVSQVAGRVPVLITVSSVATRQAIQWAQRAQKAGADYVVSTTPFYYKFPEPQSLILHARKIADSIDIPFVFYNASGCTGNPVTADICDAIFNLDNVAGIKDSGCHYNTVMELLRRYPDKANRPGIIMQGDESVFDSSLLMGADGVVSGGGVCFIEQLCALYKAGSTDDKINTFRYQRQFMQELLSLLGPTPQRDWVINIKKRLCEMGIIAAPYAVCPFISDEDEMSTPVSIRQARKQQVVALES